MIIYMIYAISGVLCGSLYQIKYLIKGLCFQILELMK